MALFVLADLHLSLGGDKPMDVFPGWENYVEKLEQNWRSVVTERDTVVVAGDISWAMRLEDTQRDFAFLHSLPGTKLLLKGNHDYWWSTKSKIESYFAQQGFDTLRVLHNNAFLVEGRALCGTRGWLYNSETAEDQKIVRREVGRLQASLDAAKQQDPDAPVLAFLHYPPVYGNMVCREIVQALENAGVSACYFGHIHGNQASKRAIRGSYRGIRMHLISCDYVKFTPVLVPPF